MATTRVLGGRYRLLERLGEGGMSVVWRAYDLTLDRPVAVKLLTARYLAHASSRHRIRAEAQAAAGLSHPHITGVHDYGEARTGAGATVPYVVMELLSGSTLAERLRAGPLPVPTALQVCAQVASALAAAHGSGLVHRDVKPANVMLTPTGAKVLDFGLVAAAGAPNEATLAGQIWGTPAYLAPERLTAGEVAPASDVYALGLLLYAALTGGRPWRAGTLNELLRAHRYAQPAPLPPIDGLPDAVAALCHRCLAKDPGDRPAAYEVARVLAGAVGWRVSAALAPRSGALPDPLAAGYARRVSGRPRAPVSSSPIRSAMPAPIRSAVPRRALPPVQVAVRGVDEPDVPGTEPTVALGRGRRRLRGGADGGWLRAVALAGSASAVVVSLFAGLWMAEQEPGYPGAAGAGVAGLGAPVGTPTPAPASRPQVASSRTGDAPAAPAGADLGADLGASPGLHGPATGGAGAGGVGGAAAGGTGADGTAAGETGTGSAGAVSPSPSPDGDPTASPDGDPPAEPTASPTPTDPPPGGASPSPPPATGAPVSATDAPEAGSGSGSGSPTASPPAEPLESAG